MNIQISTSNDSNIICISFKNMDPIYNTLYNDRNESGNYKFILNDNIEIKLHKFIIKHNDVLNTILLSHQDYWKVEDIYTEKDIDFIVKMLYKQNFEFNFYEYYKTFEFISKKFELIDDYTRLRIIEIIFDVLISVSFKRELDISLDDFSSYIDFFGIDRTINILLCKMYDVLYKDIKYEDKKIDNFVEKCLKKNIVEWDVSDLNYLKLFIIIVEIRYQGTSYKNFNFEYFKPIIDLIESYFLQK